MRGLVVETGAMRQVAVRQDYWLDRFPLGGVHEQRRRARTAALAINSDPNGLADSRD